MMLSTAPESESNSTDWPTWFICFVGAFGTACVLVYIYIIIIIIYTHTYIYHDPASKSWVCGTCTFIISIIITIIIIIIIVKYVRGGRLFCVSPHTPCVLNTMTYRVVSGHCHRPPSPVQYILFYSMPVYYLSLILYYVYI